MHKIIITSLFLISLPGWIVAQEKPFQLKEGDLLFQDLDCGPFCDAIDKVTSGVNGIDFNHVGIVVADENGDLKVLEAVSAGVKETPMSKFLNRSVDEEGLPKVAVGRLATPKTVDLKAINDKKEKYLGKGYDRIFDIDNNSYYCSELVYFLFQDKDGNPVFDLFPMTFIDPETGKTFEIWVDYYKELEKPVPEGEPGLNPGGISKSEKLNVYFPYSGF